MICSSSLDASQGGGGILPVAHGRMNRPESESTSSVNVNSDRPLNRLQQVRIQQGLTLRTVSRRTGIGIRQLRCEEDPHADLPLSVLHRWREALEVPLSELLVEPDEGLSSTIHQRAQLLRVMKTALSLREQSREPRHRRLAQMLCAQLEEFMPELSQQTPWPSVGSRRSHDELGRIAENPIHIDFDEAS